MSLLLKAASLLLEARVRGLIETRPRLLKTHCARLLLIKMIEALLLVPLRLIKIIETLLLVPLRSSLLKANRGRSLLEALRRSLLLESLIETWNMSVHIISNKKIQK